MMDTIAIICGILAGIVSSIGTMAIGFNSLSQRITVVETKQDIRDKFFETLEGRLMDLFHSPDNHYNLDELIDEYRQRQDLSMDKWIELRDKCRSISDDTSKSPGERLLATLGLSLAEHKLEVCRVSDRQG